MILIFQNEHLHMKNVCLVQLSKLLNIFKHCYFAKVYYKIRSFAY